ncbi:DUF3558 domain-containing protein [Nocardia farcinica]|nr:DUF3558 domain-containing protein [Nocardia farcinica]
MPSRQRANAGLDQNPVTSSIIFREGAPSRDPQVLIIARNVTFNPCTDLPDDVLRSTGVDPSTKRVTTDAAGSSSWRICNWEAIDLPYYLSVASTSHTQEESRNNPKLTGFRDITIGPRQALIYQDKVDSRGNICYVSLPAAQGMFEVAASWRTSQPITADRCELAVEHAKDLEPVLPK